MNISTSPSKNYNFKQKMLLSIITNLAYFIIKYISKTLRFESVNTKPIIEASHKGNNFIFAFWHNQFFAMPHFYFNNLGKTSVSILTSMSKDGEYITRVVEKFGFSTVRGSTTRGGDAAIRALVKQLQEGDDIAVTPDGPRGPRHKVQPGIITIAQLSSRPIIPVGYKVVRKKVLRTWDRFIIPSPFSSGKLIAGTPINVPQDISESAKEQLRLKLQDSLLSISDE